jgi:hypothetical protein
MTSSIALEKLSKYIPISKIFMEISFSFWTSQRGRRPLLSFRLKKSGSMNLSPFPSARKRRLRVENSKLKPSLAAL